MMTPAQVKACLDRVTYKPRTSMRVLSIGDGGTIPAIEFWFDVPDARNGGASRTAISMKAAVPRWIVTPEVFYEWLFEQVKHIEIHEAEEWFRVDGEMLRDPHAEDLERECHEKQIAGR